MVAPAAKESRKDKRVTATQDGGQIIAGRVGRARRTVFITSTSSGGAKRGFGWWGRRKDEEPSKNSEFVGRQDRGGNERGNRG